MLETLSRLLDSQLMDRLVVQWSWFWPICEILHFLGLTLLVGITGFLDLRLLGMAKQLPVAPVHRLVPWALLGFGLCLATGLVFLTGDPFNEPISMLRNLSFQLKMLFVGLAGLNAAAFYVFGVSREVEKLRAGEDAPLSAKVIAGVSLASWVLVIYFGRMLPWADAIHYALGN